VLELIGLLSLFHLIYYFHPSYSKKLSLFYLISFCDERGYFCEILFKVRIECTKNLVNYGSVELSISALFIMFCSDCIFCFTSVELMDSAFMSSFYANTFMHIAFIVLS
jgi:hypothetical protein